MKNKQDKVYIGTGGTLLNDNFEWKDYNKKH